VGAEPVGCASGGGQGLRTSSRAMPFVGRVADRIAARGLPRWVVFVSFGDCLQGLAEAADRRLAFQNGFAV
jgi:hypothetical protein